MDQNIIDDESDGPKWGELLEFESLGQDEDGIITFVGGQYGLVNASYTDAWNKANLIVTLIYELGGFKDEPSPSGLKAKENFERVVKDCTLAKEIRYELNDVYIINQHFDDRIAHMSDWDLMSLIFSSFDVIHSTNDNL
jgi:hypothetical protein